MKKINTKLAVEKLKPILGALTEWNDKYNRSGYIDVAIVNGANNVMANNDPDLIDISEYFSVVIDKQQLKSTQIKRTNREKP